MVCVRLQVFGAIVLGGVLLCGGTHANAALRADAEESRLHLLRFGGAAVASRL